jgi:membrane-associated phospholipid phosphatase
MEPDPAGLHRPCPAAPRADLPLIRRLDMKSIVPALLCCLGLVLGAGSSRAGTAHHAPPDRYAAYASLPAPDNTTGRVLFWNGAALAANAIDHTPGVPGADLDADQLGPPRTSRAFAIIHIAMFDALNAVRQRYPSYTGLRPAPMGTSGDAAVAQAAHDTLVALYPSQARALDQLLAQDLARIPFSRGKLDGIETGRQAAAAILALRANDRADYPDPIVGVNYFPKLQPGKWRPDPVSDNPLALGAYWYVVPPFVLQSDAPYHVPPPPALTSSAYAAAFNEVKRLGGDGIITPTERTLTQTLIGIYWGYDGTPMIGTRPRQYNQIAVKIARHRTTDALEMARLLALLNVAIADACTVAWDDKYHYDFWRPVTAIREASPGTGPTGQGDGNPATIADPTFTPLGAPATNTPGLPNFTPPFPSYPSGHAVLGSAAFQVLRSFYGTDNIRFTFVSDELNGINRDNRGRVRPRWPRTFPSLSAAESDNGVSRIYLGVHFRFDVDAGMQAGRRIGAAVFQRGLVQPGNP